MPSMLFVCLGNICRSPLAEAALRAEAQRLRLDLIVDSAGTGNWHVGHPPDPRAQAVARKHGIDISGYQGRQVTPADFRRFTHVIALDHDNLANLRRIQPADGVAKLSLLLDHVPGREGQAVTDPYFGDDAGFEVTWAEVTAAAAQLAERLRRTRD
ncbi:MAG: low molecular weight protein-tyrosine-phosphatase [Brevundimonas sp.]|uniref:low molecular weight protein-tyrosine-phosphatase n=1 Tax=Brevundimonas sp. TaxID=1871086 RepID=UPI0027169198|nr:low molecular weight protein-tyrosine-phosphatase [Brevundimonas sp.]MDO9610055.1 low molecular weight protein-tyrosine-phosphatase [Brevundimonas sp.]